MATSALAQEKVWIDKPSYDKAERIFHEKQAKVLPHKTMDENSIICNTSASIELQALLNTNPAPKSKSRKVKFNKLNEQDNVVTENIATKNSKNSKKSNKKKEESVTEIVNVIEASDNLIPKSEDFEIVTNTANAKKYKAKEAKEKKNKADKKHKIFEEDKNQEIKRLPIIQGGQSSTCSICPAGGSLASEVAKARQHIKQSLQCMDGIAALTGVSDHELVSRVVSIEKDNQDLRNIVQDLKNIVTKLDSRVKDLEGQSKKGGASQQSVSAPVKAPPKTEAKDDDDDDVDLFGSDSEGEDAEAARIKEERLAAYAAKKSKKPALIAKSNIILDVKPWDDETDMKVMEAEVRKIQCDGLLWGAAKLAPVAFNIQKLQISCVVEDDKVSVDWLTEQIQEIEDYVQSVDIAAFNKV